MKKIIYALSICVLLSSCGLKKEYKTMDDLKSAVDGKPLDDLVKAWGVADHYEITDVYLELTNKIVPCATSATWNSDKVKVGVIGNCDGKVSVRFDNSGSKANNYKYEIAEGVECK